MNLKKPFSQSIFLLCAPHLHYIRSHTFNTNIVPRMNDFPYILSHTIWKLVFGAIVMGEDVGAYCVCNHMRHTHTHTSHGRVNTYESREKKYCNALNQCGIRRLSEAEKIVFVSRHAVWQSTQLWWICYFGSCFFSLFPLTACEAATNALILWLFGKKK